MAGLDAYSMGPVDNSGDGTDSVVSTDQQGGVGGVLTSILNSAQQAYQSYQQSNTPAANRILPTLQSGQGQMLLAIAVVVALVIFVKR